MQLSVHRTDLSVPRADFARLGRVIERAIDARDTDTLETVIDYLGRLRHVHGLDKPSFATIVALYVVTLSAWGEIVGVSTLDLL